MPTKFILIRQANLKLQFVLFCNIFHETKVHIFSCANVRDIPRPILETLKKVQHVKAFYGFIISHYLKVTGFSILQKVQHI